MNVWSLEGRNALPFLEAIEPYLIVKRQVAQNAIAFLRTLNAWHRGVRRPAEIYDLQNALAVRHAQLMHSASEGV
jgi:hypothetical protein